MTEHSNNALPPDDDQKPWYKLLNRYHWFVFVVCSLGWGLDCFDQQIFNVMRNPALSSLMGVSETDAKVVAMGGYATSLMLIGWAVGGILFGIMGDKIGRARTMVFTILVYATFTGMSGLAVGWLDFLIYRFLTGMGVGGQFAAGVTLLAETMPNKARPKTLGLLQIVAAACNLTAASLALICSLLQQHTGLFDSFPIWRTLFIIGFLPAILAFVVMRKLEEPEAWKAAIAAGGSKKVGSIRDLFTDPRWRYNVIIGMLLATCGVIGLWGIGFFSVDLTRITLRNARNLEVRESGDVEKLDYEIVRMLVQSPKEFLPVAMSKNITPQSFIDQSAVDTHPKTNVPGTIYQIVYENREKLDGLNIETALATLDAVKAPTEDELQRRNAILKTAPADVQAATFDKLASELGDRSKSINSYVAFWAAITSLLFNFGAIFGTWGITLVAERFGRRPAFTVFFTASLIMTLIVFLTMDTPTKVIIMIPILGFCVLSLMGGYAIYFPELFPTRLRSTAVSFCYNIGRFIAATGPMGLGILTAYVFHETAEPIRYAGAAMSITFVFGIIITWLGPETKGKPLPE